VKNGLAVHRGVAVRLGVEASVEVGSGVALGVNVGSRQAGVESTRAAGARVWPSWS
jgi:hypothetical protein